MILDVRRKAVKHSQELKESAEMQRHVYRSIRDRNSTAARDAMRDHLVWAQKHHVSEDF